MEFFPKPTNSLFRTPYIDTRVSTTQNHISHRLILIALFAVAFSLQICNTIAAIEQTEQDTDFQLSCETKTLDDVPPDPVSFRQVTTYVGLESSYIPVFFSSMMLQRLQ